MNRSGDFDPIRRQPNEPEPLAVKGHFGNLGEVAQLQEESLFFGQRLRDLEGLFIGGDSAGGCSCCGDSGSGEPIEGVSTVDADGVQRIAVDASDGFNPNVIVLASGVPTEITFSEGYGCMAQVMSSDLDFYEDLQSGPKTITLGPLEPGTYDFSCGMEMIFGQIVVEERI